MSTIEEIKAFLAASVTESEHAATAISGAADRLEEVLARLRLTAVGSVHPALTDALNRMAQAKMLLDEAHMLVRGAMDSANVYRATI